MSDSLKRVAAALALAALLGGGLGACARPTGDLGRAQPSYLHDEALPTIGRNRAQLAKEPVSRFNQTDEEHEMHDRVWRFLVAPHAGDWFMDTAVELQRTRLSGIRDHTFRPDRYYRWLHKRDYESSRVRFRTVADHAQSDIDTAPETFAAICRVIEIDRQRAYASRELGNLSPGDVAARRAENDTAVAWFTRALRYRYDAYGYALDHLLVETPHAEAMETDARLSELGVWVERAERGDFCVTAGSLGGRGGTPIPSRVLMPTPGEGVYKK